jgi:predicted phosphodiesterase
LTGTIAKDTIGKVKEIIEHFEGRDKYIEALMQPPKERLKSELSIVEHKACTEEKKPGQILVFGHTHRPFVNTDNNVVNAGSWVSDADITNTFVELEGNKIRLQQYDKGKVTEITTREKCTS